MEQTRRQRGQAIAELALAMPMLAVILFGLAEMGLMINDQVTIANAARNGARVAALNAGSQTAVNTAVSDATSGPTSLIRCIADTPAVTQIGTPPASDGWQVTASCVYTPVTPLAPLFSFFGGTAGSTYTISASNTMKDSTCLPPCH